MADKPQRAPLPAFPPSKRALEAQASQGNKMVGNKKAVLIGCNYPTSEYSLKGCANDVKVHKNNLITYFGFEEKDITILLDTDPSTVQPTGKNIKVRTRPCVLLTKLAQASKTKEI